MSCLVVVGWRLSSWAILDGHRALYKARAYLQYQQWTLSTVPGGDRHASALQARVETERHLPDILERLVRREQLHERSCPHVAVESREGTLTQVTRPARGRERTVHDLDSLARHEPFGALEVFHLVVERIERHAAVWILLEQRISQGRRPAEHGAGGRQVDLDFGDGMLDGIPLGEDPATQALALCRDKRHGGRARCLGNAQEGTHQAHGPTQIAPQKHLRPLPPGTDIDQDVVGDQAIRQYHVMTARGTHAQGVPVFPDVDARTRTRHGRAGPAELALGVS